MVNLDNLNILLIKSLVILFFSILPSPNALGDSTKDRILIQEIQNHLELGNLSRVTQLLEQISNTSYKKVLEANLAARVGDYDQAITLYKESIGNFQDLTQKRLIWNYIQALRERIKYYEWQLTTEKDPLSRQDLQEKIESDRELALTLARNNRDDLEISVLLFQLNPEEVELDPIRKKIEKSEDSQEKVETLIAVSELQAALEVAQRLNQHRFLSWAYSALGRQQLHEGLVDEAIISLDRSRMAANQAQDHLAIARTSSDLAKAYLKQGNRERAKLNYRLSVAAIERIRKTVAGYRVDPLLFQEIQSILRDYLALLLNSPSLDQETLKEAIQLQKLSTLSELDSYFKSLCDVESQVTSKVQKDTAYIYTVILDDRLLIILQTPQGYTSQSIAIPKAQLDELLYQWRLALSDPTDNDYIEDGRKLYDLLIRPIESLLIDKKRLIFVQDGLLRTIPMAALIDGKQFLVERYKIAYSLGFKLQEPNQRLRTALVAGSSQTSTEILENVNREVAELSQILSADILSGQELTEQSLSQRLQNRSYDVLHIATRNRILPNIEQSIFSLGQQDISLLDFERILRNRKGKIAFLNLAGCDTASGNAVAILGLTGIGLRSGIVTTVGSLWGIDDDITTDFMIEFYQNLQQTENYEDSLRQAQLKAISNPSLHPHAWAGFLVLTNE
ncbi:CHAT domain-containing protein [Chroococcus sp. FPU101]|uniref:CHAT domain-containing protein n=1 Tax=Chroococcus sp. FPU101 TaxID=1974212 RepID=UPI001A8F440A|nr:CHAT domain-containing protein [Chroococcus sp. FPU101]